MANSQDWTKALLAAMEERVNTLGEFIEEVAGPVGDLNCRVEILTTQGVGQSNTPNTVAPTNGVVITEGNNVRLSLKPCTSW